MTVPENVEDLFPKLPEGYFFRVGKNTYASLTSPYPIRVELRRRSLFGSKKIGYGISATTQEDILAEARKLVQGFWGGSVDSVRYLFGDHPPK